jgi:hypothetical protein
MLSAEQVEQIRAAAAPRLAAMKHIAEQLQLLQGAKASELIVRQAADQFGRQLAGEVDRLGIDLSNLGSTGKACAGRCAGTALDKLSKPDLERLAVDGMTGARPLCPRCMAEVGRLRSTPSSTIVGP